MEAGERKTAGILAGKVFLFTGELESVSRPEAQALVESLGGSIASSVTKAVDYVVVGKEPGSKYEKARTLKKQVLDEEQFLAMVRRS